MDIILNKGKHRNKTINKRYNFDKLNSNLLTTTLESSKFFKVPKKYVILIDQLVRKL